VPETRVTLTLPAIPLLDPEQARAVLRLEVGTALSALIEQIADEARQRTPVGATGLLRASIATRLVQGEDAATLVRGEVFTGEQAPYAQAVEEGTAPHFPPIAPLKLWAARVLGNEQLAWAVAVAISRRGTQGKHMFQDALTAVQDQIEPTIQAAVERAAQRLQEASSGA
jgi:hypothetical protein